MASLPTFRLGATPKRNGQNGLVNRGEANLVIPQITQLLPAGQVQGSSPVPVRLV